MADYRKCKECKWLDLNKKCSVGYLCRNPYKHFRTKTAMWKSSCTKACLSFTEREDGKEQTC